MSSIRTFINERNYTVISGVGALDRLGESLSQFGITRPLLVSTRSLEGSDLATGIIARAGSRTVRTFHGARAHAPLSCIRDGAAELAAGSCDGIISLGGSSAVDVAKGIAMLAAYGSLAGLKGTARPSAGRLDIDHAALGGSLVPIIAIPTTLSGAEFTYQAGITDEESGTKSQYYDRAALPRHIILDANATLATPAQLWLSTGIKAVDHDVERLYSLDHQAISDPLCLESLEILYRELGADDDGGGTLESRQRLLNASWLAQFSTKNVNVGVGHALGHQIAGLLDTPHGSIACVLLPYSMRFNAEAGREQLERISERLGGAPGVDGAIDAIERLVRRLGMPTRLRDIGVPRESLPRIAAGAITDTAITGNPRIVSDPDEILDEILEPAW